ncbi:hypothetical protein Ddye_015131 [Dipteronia dyeriana]|uniref:ABC-2 type transporter transmembrane domain-containing protein n=1 Tax=Dipteronia dyeriana TaxID=168575 RepID=A0AAD9WZ27_9ROSI|nr:hypothetical protein Ddye_015131 [Dipteronia dyeriana]
MPELFGIRLGAVVVTGFILATMFWHLDNSPKGVQERLGFFAFAMSTTFYTCAEAIPVFLQERYIFMRETAYNAYRRSSYVLAQSIISFPALILLSLSFAAITFSASHMSCRLHGGSRHLGLFPPLQRIFHISRQNPTALDMVPLHFSSQVPYEGILQNEFADPNKCFVRGVQLFDKTPLGNFPMSMKLNLLKSMSGVLGFNVTSSTCVTTGSDILTRQGITDISKWNCLWILVAWGFFFRILFYFTLLLGSKNRRR